MFFLPHMNCLVPLVVLSPPSLTTVSTAQRCYEDWSEPEAPVGQCRAD